MNSHPTSARDVPTRVFAAFDAGDIAALDTLVSPDLIDHNLPPGAPSAIEGMKGMVAAMRDGFTTLTTRSSTRPRQTTAGSSPSG
jgi:ketosteroid isomerase-like protein